MQKNVPLNKFSLIGIVNDNPVILNSPKGYKVCKFVLCVKSVFNYDKLTYVPIIAIKELGSKCSTLCQKGNMIAVDGELISKEKFNYEKRSFQTQLYFLAKSIKLIKRNRITMLKKDNILDLITMYDCDNYSVNKSNNVCIKGNENGQKTNK